MTVTVRMLPTGFGRDEAIVSVATPTCCCCCCCLATVAATSTFLASESGYQAIERGAPPELPTIIGALAVPAAMAMLWTAPDLGPIEPWHLATTTLAVCVVSALLLARVPWPRIVLTTLLLVLVGSVLFAVEFVVALFTVLMIELVAPLAAWGAWAVARSVHRNRVRFHPWPAPDPRARR